MNLLNLAPLAFATLIAASEALSGAPGVRAQPAVTRFEFFKTESRQSGVWVVQQGPLRFRLPITDAPKPGLAQHLPAPHGLPGFAAPVDQAVPALVPFLELEDARTIVATDGADSIEVRDNGRSLTARWTSWALVGGKAGERIDPGLESEVRWTIDDRSVTRTERLTARRPITIRRWRVIVSSTATRWIDYSAGTTRTDVFDSPDGVLSVTLVRADWPYGTSRTAASPIHLRFEAAEIALSPGQPRSWTLRLEAGGTGAHD
ncbi:MAG TPA: hypothetical protein VHJ77_04535 [Vicinamibacterales bacterium]|jgi:hypothetical protein|nr:hypothetical protein [Vicinamibacterales bacterium]